MTAAPEASDPENARTGIQPRSVFARLPRYAAGRPPKNVAGLQPYKLASNENPLGPVPAVLEAIAGQKDFHRYPDPLSTKLRNALADFLEVPADDVVTGTGSLGALNQLLATFAGANDGGLPDEVVYAWRSFEAYPICVGLAGAISVQVPVTADGRHDLAAMAAAVTERTKVVLLCTPNNPTGPALGTAEVEDFLARVPSDVVVVIDEAYEDFVRMPDAVDGISMYRKHPNVVVLRTFSKAHGLANLRVGYSVSRPELTAFLRVAAIPFAVSSVAETAAVASLQHYEEVAGRVETLVQERNRVVDRLHELGWFFPRADGNFVWLPLGERTAGFAALVEERALSVRAFPGEGVRVTIGETEANTRFLEACAEYPHGPGVS